MQGEETEIRLAGLKGATSMGMVRLLEEADSGKTADSYSFTLAGSADEITPKLVKGDLLKIGDQTYTVTQDSGAAASNAIANVHVSPALPAITANTEVTLIGSHTANLAFHPMAFAFVTRPLTAPGGVESYVTNYNGVSLRVVRGYDMQHKREMLSMDVLYGFQTLYPELAVRVLG